MLILAGGIVDDTTGWLMLSLVAGLATAGTIDIKSVGVLVIEGAAFLGFCYFIGYRLVRSLMRWIDDRTYIEHGKFSAMIIIAIDLRRRHAIHRTARGIWRVCRGPDDSQLDARTRSRSRRVEGDRPRRDGADLFRLLRTEGRPGQLVDASDRAAARARNRVRRKTARMRHRRTAREAETEGSAGGRDRHERARRHGESSSR